MRRPVARFVVGLVGAAIAAYGVLVAFHASVEIEGNTTTTMIWTDGVDVAGVVVGLVGLALVAFAAWPRRSKPQPLGDVFD